MPLALFVNLARFGIVLRIELAMNEAPVVWYNHGSSKSQSSQNHPVGRAVSPLWRRLLVLPSRDSAGGRCLGPGPTRWPCREGARGAPQVKQASFGLSGGRSAALARLVRGIGA